MATYNSAAVSDAVIAFQKPITLQQGRSLRDNPEATAEGATGAPRIQGRALGSVYMGRLELTNTTENGFTGLDRFGVCKADFTASWAGASALGLIEVRYSSDNGVSHGAWQSSGVGPGEDGIGTLLINLQTGVYSAHVFRELGASIATTRGNGTHTVPSDCNAFQIRFASGAGSGAFMFYNLGGIE